MPSKLDDADLDARWRAGLEAAAEDGRWVEVEARVQRRVNAHRRQRTITIAAAAVCALVLVVGTALVVDRSEGQPVRTGSAPTTVQPTQGPPDDEVWIHSGGTDPDVVVGPNVLVQVEALSPSTLRFDEAPGVAFIETSHYAGAGSWEGTGIFAFAPGRHPYTLQREDSDDVVRGSLEVRLPEWEPIGQADSVALVEARPSLTLVATGPVAAGAVEIDVRNGGGTHRIRIDEVPGFQVTVPPDRARRKVALAPGEYTLYCAVPGHRQAGMETTLTVVGP